MTEWLAGWLLNYLVHSTVLLGGVWAIERAGWLKHPAWREAFWRWAFFGAVLTASLQPLLHGTRVTLPSEVAAPSAPSAALATAAAQPALPAEPTTLPAAHPAPVVDESMTRRRQLLHDAFAALLLSWPLIAALGMALTMLRWLSLRREVRALPPCDDDELRQAAAELARSAGVAMPALRLSPVWPSPLVAPGGQICLPASLMRTLDGQQRVAVLAHEIAHLRRRDPGWRLAARLVSQLGWLQPLNRLATRRLDLLAELSCDAWAAAEAGAMPLAESLYVCARDGAATGRAKRGRRAMPVLASAMAAARSPLMARMHALLEEFPMSDSTPSRRRLGRLALAAGLCALALSVPMLVIGKVPRLKIDVGAVLGDHKVTRYVHDDNGHEQRASYDGDLVFNDDETDVVSLDRKLEISETERGVTRRAEIVNDGRGGTTRRFWIDDKEQPLDADARQWLSGQIGLVAELTQGSEPRARRLLQRGGTAAVLADIEKSRDTFVRRSRIEALLAVGRQDDATLSRLIAQSATLDGDFDRRSALDAVVAHRTLSPALQREVLQATERMQGAFERRQVLEGLAPQLSRDAAVMAEWQQAVRGIDGDFEKRSAIVTLVEAQKRVDRALALSVLGAVEAIRGDFERAQVLIALAERMPADAELIARYRQAARGLSTHERGRVEEALDHLTPA
ncbi:M56 family metallopeptidase [Roseateles sp.]|uniref:M56 family metallopeptidase n=1 Tax=Roseateles sp. TaxID=1971397 RepID=UPI0031D6B21A